VLRAPDPGDVEVSRVGAPVGGADERLGASRGQRLGDRGHQGDDAGGGRAHTGTVRGPRGALLAPGAGNAPPKAPLLPRLVAVIWLLVGAALLVSAAAAAVLRLGPRAAAHREAAWGLVAAGTRRRTASTPTSRRSEPPLGRLRAHPDAVFQL